MSYINIEALHVIGLFKIKEISYSSTVKEFSTVQNSNPLEVDGIKNKKGVIT